MSCFLGRAAGAARDTYRGDGLPRAALAVAVRAQPAGCMPVCHSRERHLGTLISSRSLCVRPLLASKLQQNVYTGMLAVNPRAARTEYQRSSGNLSTASTSHEAGRGCLPPRIEAGSALRIRIWLMNRMPFLRCQGTNDRVTSPPTARICDGRHVLTAHVHEISRWLTRMPLAYVNLDWLPC